MELYITAITDTGCVREQNEDRILVGGKILREGRWDIQITLAQDNHLFVAVADGVGGHAAGEVAAELVLEKMHDKISLLKPGLKESELRERIERWSREVHEFILEESKKNSERARMGTTLVGVLFYDESVYYINVGDSRLYRFRDGYLVQVSRDHSVRALTGVPSHVILNCFGGGSETMFVDFDQVSKRIFGGDILILCSDGLTDVIADEDIEFILRGAGDFALEMVKTAKDRCGTDNISVVVIQIRQP
jgi:protein phosphatase